MKEIYGLSRTRDKTGRIVKRSLNPYVNCLHTQIGGARDNMEVYVIEVMKEKNICALNPCEDGTARTIKSQYYKNGRANFARQDGLGATGVMEDWQTVLGSKQYNSYIASTEECSSCITSACGAGGGMTPMLTDAPLEIAKTKEFFEQVRGHEAMRYRIRKLTPRECFRLMDVDDADIDRWMWMMLTLTKSKQQE